MNKNMLYCISFVAIVLALVFGYRDSYNQEAKIVVGESFEDDGDFAASVDILDKPNETYSACFETINKYQVSATDVTLLGDMVEQKFHLIVQNQLVNSQFDKYLILNALAPAEINTALYDRVALKKGVDISSIRDNGAIVPNSVITNLISIAQNRNDNVLKAAIKSLPSSNVQLLASNEKSLLASLLKQTSIEDFIFIFNGFEALEHSLSVLDLVDALTIQIEMEKLTLLVGYSQNLIHSSFDFRKGQSLNFITFALINMRIDAARFFLEKDVDPYTNLYKGGPLDDLARSFIDIDAQYFDFVRASLDKGYFTMSSEKSETLKNKLRNSDVPGNEDLFRHDYSFKFELPLAVKNTILTHQVSILNTFLDSSIDFREPDISRCISIFYNKVKLFLQLNDKGKVVIDDIVSIGEKEASDIYSLFLKGVYDEELLLQLLGELNTIASKTIVSRVLDKRSQRYYTYLLRQRESREVASAYNTVFWLAKNDEIEEAINEIQGIPTISPEEKEDILVEVLITTVKSPDLILENIIEDGRISENNVIQLIKTNQVEIIESLLEQEILTLDWQNSATRNLLWNAVDMKATRTAMHLLSRGASLEAQIAGDFDVLDKVLLTAFESPSYKKIAEQILAKEVLLDKSHQQLVDLIRLKDSSFNSSEINNVD